MNKFQIFYIITVSLGIILIYTALFIIYVPDYQITSNLYNDSRFRLRLLMFLNGFFIMIYGIIELVYNYKKLKR